ncbi:hypothetical protein [Spirosoma jeollabukense]
MKKLLIFWSMVGAMGCESEPPFEYFTSPDNGMVITLMRYNKRLYFTNGRYNKNKVPASFISPIHDIDNAYLCYIHWCGEEGAEILSPYGDWLDTEKDPQLKFRKIDANELGSIMKSKTDEYIYCYGNAFPN